jgi:hypothetical protein
MLNDFISAVGGGEVLRQIIGGALGAGAATLLLPKVHLGLMVGITSWFPRSRIRRAFLEAFSVAHGGELPPPPQTVPPKKEKGRKGRKRRNR